MARRMARMRAVLILQESRCSSQVDALRYPLGWRRQRPQALCLYEVCADWAALRGQKHGVPECSLLGQCNRPMTSGTGFTHGAIQTQLKSSRGIWHKCSDRGTSAIDSQGMKLSSLQPITPRLLRKLLGERLSTAGTVVFGLGAPLVEAGQAEVVLAGGL